MFILLFIHDHFKTYLASLWKKTFLNICERMDVYQFNYYFYEYYFYLYISLIYIKFLFYGM
jgi:hypothetical protein